MKRWPQYLLIFFLSIQACKKPGDTDDGDKQPPPPPPPPGNVNCTATKADAENIGIFPVDNAFNTDISAAQVDPYNTQIIAALAGYSCKADFGAGLWEGAPIGIPYVVVCGSQPKYGVTFRGNDYDDDYGDESDAGPYAIPLNAAVEGNGDGDAHVIAVDKENKILYELYNASVNGNH